MSKPKMASKEEYQPLLPRVHSLLRSVVEDIARAEPVVARLHNARLQDLLSVLHALQEDGALPPLLAKDVCRDLHDILYSQRGYLNLLNPTMEQWGMLAQIDTLARKLGGLGFTYGPAPR